MLSLAYQWFHSSKCVKGLHWFLTLMRNDTNHYNKGTDFLGHETLHSTDNRVNLFCGAQKVHAVTFRLTTCEGKYLTQIYFWEISRNVNVLFFALIFTRQMLDILAGVSVNINIFFAI